MASLVHQFDCGLFAQLMLVDPHRAGKQVVHEAGLLSPEFINPLLVNSDLAINTVQDINNLLLF